MASVIRDANGTKRVQWTVAGGDRRTLRLGAVSVRQAEAVKIRVEQVLASKSTGVLDPEAERWLRGLDDTMHEKLARLGLVQSRASTSATVGSLLDAYFSLLSVKPGTRRVYEQTRTALEDHFGKTCALTAVTPLACDQWRQAMRDEGLADATIAKRIKTARQMFKKAVRWKMVQENPFADIRAGAMTNRSRMVFVAREQMDKVLAECPDEEWRLLVLLSRIGGLRTPSESLALRWQDIDFEKNLMHVTSCKTEHIEGHDVRIVPLFAELREPLLLAFSRAEEGATHVIARHRLPCGNLRTQMHRFIKRAGMTPWAKPFHNMRSSRQIELCEEFPLHVVCEWLGNSPAIARAHYLKATQTHIDRAVGRVTGSPTLAGGAVGVGGGDNGAGSAVAGNVGQRTANGANVAA